MRVGIKSWKLTDPKYLYSSWTLGTVKNEWMNSCVPHVPDSLGNYIKVLLIILCSSQKSHGKQSCLLTRAAKGKAWQMSSYPSIPAWGCTSMQFISLLANCHVGLLSSSGQIWWKGSQTSVTRCKVGISFLPNSQKQKYHFSQHRLINLNIQTEKILATFLISLITNI